MKTSLEIINKLSDKEAVKLESQLVELALINEIKKSINSANDLYDASLKEIRNINSGVLMNSIRFYNETISSCDAIIKKAKEIGVEIKEADNIKAIAVKNLKQAESIKSKISNI
jgi:cell fate (sporulation/competence/biofilm development) regulator YmcA (YheA/YmcA/DUF963 family)